jgi:hypothetical protein
MNIVPLEVIARTSEVGATLAPLYSPDIWCTRQTSSGDGLKKDSEMNGSIIIYYLLIFFIVGYNFDLLLFFPGILTLPHYRTVY